MNNNNRYLLKLALLMSVPIILIEYLFRTSIRGVLQWMVQNPLIFLVNLTLLVALALLFGFLFKKLYRGVWFVLVGSVILGIVNGNKVNLRNVPFEPRDVFLVREFFVLTPNLLTPMSIAAVLLVGPVLFGIYRLMRKLFGDGPNRDIKISALTTVGICLVIFMVGEGLYTEAHGPWKLGFIYSLPRAVVDNEPETSLKWEEVKGELTDEASEEIQKNTKFKDQDPNIIIVMSESFWDVNLLDGDFSPNPIANFERLKEESIHGEVYTPVFGGGTANMEFEVLTGLSLKTYPADWHIVYRNEIEAPMPSLASILKERGYQTEALHPYHHWYYRRDEVYPLLGFNDFTALRDMDDSKTLGPFISDDYVTDQIIEQIEESEEPIFNFTVTMQNHGPYHELRNEPVIDFNHNLDERQETLLQTFADGLYYSDQALQRLIDYLEASDEPTLLLFFGDHLPMLGNNYSIYREMGFIGEESPEELQDDLRLYSVPYILWANYSLDQQELPLQNATALPLLVLEQAGIEKPLHLQVAKEIHDRAPLILNDYYIDGEGNRHDRETEEYQEIIEWYRTLRMQLEDVDAAPPVRSFE